MQRNQSDHDAALTRRIASQMQNIWAVNPGEAFDICTAYARVLASMIGSVSDSEEDLVQGLRLALVAFEVTARGAFTMAQAARRGEAQA